MRLAGVDFTSAPSKRKPIVVCTGVLLNGRVSQVDLRSLSTPALFRDFLGTFSFDRLGVDAPLALPLEFLQTIGVGSWEDSIRWATSLEKGEYFAIIRAFVSSRPSGNKEPKRACDKAIGAASPLKLYNPGVGWMHFALAKHLSEVNAAVLPFQKAEGHRSVVEVYPGAFAKKRLSNVSYKNDPVGDVDRPQRRQVLIDALEEWMDLSPDLRLLAREDDQGDVLDSLIALAQTAFSINETVPASCAEEGWIFGASL